MIHHTNYWFELYNSNQHLLSEKTLNESKNYLNFNRPTDQKGYDNYFWIDGSSDRTLWNVVSEFLEHKDQLLVPEINREASTLFFTYAEGWGGKKIFDTLHGLIDIFKLNGDCYYQNCTVNTQDLYDRFCETNNLPKKIKCVYENRAFLLEKNNRFYVIPNSSYNLKILPFEEKKLFTSLNWNNWPHRLALIGLMNYYDLIEDGNITSPGVYKYKYDQESDYALLRYTVEEFFKDDHERNAILDKLPAILKNYPLVVDDRTQYTDTESAVMKSSNIGPIYQARVNGLIEVIPETLYSGEHFFSEKTFWAMLLSKPYIMVNGAGSLESLRKIGFKTFSPYIDESYDLEQDGVIRLKKIALELKRLKELRKNDPVTFKENYDKMVEIGEYNKSVLLTYLKGNLPTC